MNLGLQDSNRIAEQAARYLGALTEGNVERPAFFAWLAESPRHVEEFLFVLQAAQRVAAFTPEQEARLQEVTGGRLEHLGGKVVQLENHPRREPIARSRRTARWLTAAAAIAALAFTGLWLAASGQWQTYTTATGEQRTLKLADGSMVLMNTGSKLKVRLGSDERTLKLVAGEALFTAARDAARPFRVYAGDTVIEAIGTQFGVYRAPNGTHVSVLEGVVQVAARSDVSQPKTALPRLTAGEEASVAVNGKIVERGRLDPVKTVAWRQRRLVFEDETLENIVREFNRYNVSPKIEVQDAAAASRRFSGTFDADAPQKMLDTLSGNEALSITPTDEGFRIGTNPRTH